MMEADADLEKVLVIDDRDTPLTLAEDVYKRQGQLSATHPYRAEAPGRSHAGSV